MSTTECQELAAKVRDKILLEPNSHVQETWMMFLPKDVKAGESLGSGTKLVSCNTTGCVAGWASILSGDSALVASMNGEERNLPGRGLRHVFQAHQIRTPDGQQMHIGTRGAEVLCLDGSAQEWLFAASRSKVEVIYALSQIAIGQPVGRIPEYRVLRLLGDKGVKEMMAPPEIVKPKAVKKPAEKPVETIDIDELIGDPEKSLELQRVAQVASE